MKIGDKLRAVAALPEVKRKRERLLECVSAYKRGLYTRCGKSAFPELFWVIFSNNIVDVRFAVESVNDYFYKINNLIEPPEFPARREPNKTRFDWWGWHPSFPKWSRSCWGGATEAEARENLPSYELTTDALKLVREDSEGRFKVIESIPPREISAYWRK